MPLITDAGTLRLVAYVAVRRGDRILLVEYEPRPSTKRKGWWLPAPELEYGDHPARRVEEVLAELGLTGAPYVLAEVESSVGGTGWHLAFHYRVEADGDPRPGPAVRRHAWFGAGDLPPPEAFALGAQGRDLALRSLRGGARGPGLDHRQA